MEANQNRHPLTQTQAALSVAMRPSITKQLFLPNWFKLLAEVID
jgi:hypothetical protein